MKTFRLLFTLFVVLIISQNDYLNATPEYGEDQEKLGRAINIAGFQRMLTQRIGKNYLAVLVEIDDLQKDWHFQAIKDDIVLFEENISSLTSIIPNNRKVEELLKKEQEEWEVYKTLVDDSPDLANGKTIIEVSKNTLAACHNLVLELEKQAKSLDKKDTENGQFSNLAELVNKSGRQRMLSQRIAFLYLAQYLNLESNNLSFDYSNAIRDYSNAFTLLSNSFENTPTIDYHFVNVTKHWGIMESICQNIDQGQDKDISQLLIASDLLLTEMNTITGLYEKLISVKVETIIHRNATVQASQLRLLTQSMAKCYAAILLDLESKKHQTELSEMVKEFETGLQELKDYASVPELQKTLEIAESEWSNYESIVGIMPTEKGFEELLVSNNLMLTVCNNIVLMLKLQGRTMDIHSVAVDESLSGSIDKLDDQRVYAQQAAFYALANVIKPLYSPIEKKITVLKSTYNTINSNLFILPHNNNKIVEYLEVDQSIWKEIHEKYIATDLSSSQQKSLLNAVDRLSDNSLKLESQYNTIISNAKLTNAANQINNQKMLVEQLAKNYVFILINVSSEINKVELEQSILQFDESISELSLLAETPDIKEALKQVNVLWAEYKRAIESTPNDVDLQQIIEQNTPLLDACEAVVASIAKEVKMQSKTDSVVTSVNIVGHQKMLSQRAIIYALFFIQSDYSVPEYQEIAIAALTDYRESILQLKTLKIEDESIDISGVELAHQKAEQVYTYIKKADIYELILTSNLMFSESDKLMRKITQSQNI